MAIVTWHRWALAAALVLLVSACTTGSSDTGGTTRSIPEAITNDISTTNPPSTSDGTPPTTQPFNESTSTAPSPPPTTAAASTTVTTSTTVLVLPAVTAASGTQDDPVPLGEFIGLDDWILAVTDVAFDATELLQDAAEFNMPPPSGMQYVVIGLTGTYRGDNAGQPVVEWQLILGDLIVPGAGDECGLVPDNLIDVQPMMTGSTFEANICFVAPISLGDEPPLLKLEPVDQSGETNSGFFFSIT